jgi:L-seryl-tRNA(Ser) seleniumtransferase
MYMDNQLHSEILRTLPSVDSLLRGKVARKFIEEFGSQVLADFARNVTARLRAEILSLDNGGSGQTREALYARAESLLAEAVERDRSSGIVRVINATGVILHTNLGRAILSRAAVRHISDDAAGYCTVEYDLTTGERGQRGARVGSLLEQLTGAESAVVVNNCAAAAFLTLLVLAADGETVISRGELVEIGGDFRVPDVMASSGTRLVEVGTTNRTRISDYVKAINERTRLIMRVHPSNYRIIGFTAAPSVPELAELAHNSGLPLYLDAGSGALVDLSSYGLADEPVISHEIAAGADVVTFSGDKLLGGPQAGIIVGKTELIGRIRKHPLFRALRADKLVLAGMEATLESYRRGTHLVDMPVLRALSTPVEELEVRARDFAFRLSAENERLNCEVIPGSSAMGGGSAPAAELPTSLVAVNHLSLTPETLEAQLRASTPPVIARIANDRVIVDLRTVSPDEEAELLNAFTMVGG